jgi:segregation and condensation protein B
MPWNETSFSRDAQRNALSPSPLVGEGWGGGYKRPETRTPHPHPPPQGGRESTRSAALYGYTARSEVMSSTDESAAPPPIERIIEALLFVGGAPLTAQRAAEAVRGLNSEDFRILVDGLNRAYRQQGRPYRVLQREQGWELALQPKYRSVLDRLYGTTRESRLSPAALDVLALVAYRQPISKQEVEALRGADSGSAMRQLVRLGLIAVQRGEADRREVTYSTTSRFLTLFQLRSLDDLPRTQDLQKL